MTKPSGRSEQILLDLFRRGDNEAGNEIVLLYRDKLFGMCYNILGCHDLAAEVVQEAFFKLLKNRKRIDPKRNFSSFIHRIAYNLCLDQIRRRKLSVNMDDFSWVQEEAASPEARISYSEIKKSMQKVWNTIDSLPISARTILELRYRSQLSPDEISDVLEIPSSTVRVKLHRARKLLAAKLSSLSENETKTAP